MKTLNCVLIGVGSILIVSSAVYLLFNLNDRSAELALPILISGVAIIAIDIFMNIVNQDNKISKRRTSLRSSR